VAHLLFEADRQGFLGEGGCCGSSHAAVVTR
jgi:hypothetical protein